MEVGVSDATNIYTPNVLDNQGANTPKQMGNCEGSRSNDTKGYNGMNVNVSCGVSS